MLIPSLLVLASLSDTPPKAPAEEPPQTATSAVAVLTSSDHIRIGSPNEPVEVQGLIFPASAISAPLVLSNADKIPAPLARPQASQTPGQSKQVLPGSAKRPQPEHPQ
jgi:hypothetical protein